MKKSKVIILLSYLVAFLLIVAGWAGVYIEGTYAKEAANWAEQGIGQDYINLFLVVPLLLVLTYFFNKGSFKAYLIWLGVQFYIMYSYFLYSFFIHFGPMFLVYVALLGLSFYLSIFSLCNINYIEVRNKIKNLNTKPTEYLLQFIAFAFILLWGSEIIKNLINGEVPEAIIQIGLPVNPVHVLDLAFLLPGAIIVAKLLKKKSAIGVVLAVPFMVFFIVMGVAIISMAVVTSHGDFNFILPVFVIMSVIIALNGIISNNYLLRIE